MVMIQRAYDLHEYITPGKVVVIQGPRQTGKTTLVRQYLNTTTLRHKFVQGDDVRVHEYLGSRNTSLLRQFVEGYELLVIDEAQNIPYIGENLKLIVDTMPHLHVVATGSASFALAGQLGEPLVGRKWTLMLYPIATLELSMATKNRAEMLGRLEDDLIYGGYPAVVTAGSVDLRQQTLYELVGSYLLRDILAFEGVKSPKILLDLLKMIAFQIGGEVSMTELGSSLDIDKKTVARYLDLLEKSYVLYNVRGFSRNLRKEITKTSRYYFLDNGIRNAVIGNFNSLSSRDDVGQLWENYLVMERRKKQAYRKMYANNYFWRTWDQKEVDWVEDREGKLFGYEFKWNTRKLPKPPKDWLNTYDTATYEVITPENYLDFIT